MRVDRILEPKMSRLLYGANVRANGIRQHYLRFGGYGPPLVIIPGIATPAAMWAFVGERLALDYDVYVLDVRGRGLSESGPHLDYSEESCASDVIAFADALNLHDYTILGHSMGARIAVRIARRQTQSLGRIVLVDPPVSGPGRRAYPSPLPKLLEFLHAAQRGEADEVLRRPGSPAWPEQHIRTRAEWLHTCDERAVVQAHREFHERDIQSDLPHITIPTALIVAGKGGVILPEDEDEIRRLLPSIVIRRLERAGHQVQVDDLEGFLAVIAEVLPPARE